MLDHEADDQPTPVFERGVRLAVDVGEARIGVARCDADGILAVPVETIQRRQVARAGLPRLAQLTADLGALRVYVGLPLSMNGTKGKAALRIEKYAEDLAELVAPTPVHLVDERLTTVTAHAALSSAGKKMKDHRKVVDQVAAVAMLDNAIAQEKSTGRPAGQAILVNTD